MYHISEIKNALSVLRQEKPEYQISFIYASNNTYSKPAQPYVGNRGALQVWKPGITTKTLAKARYEGKGYWKFDKPNILTRTIIYNRLECTVITNPEPFVPEYC